MAESGAQVIATARDIKKAPGLQGLLQTQGHGGALQVVTLDVADAASVKVRPTARGVCFHVRGNGTYKALVVALTGCWGRASAGPWHLGTGHVAHHLHRLQPHGFNFVIGPCLWACILLQQGDNEHHLSACKMQDAAAEVAAHHPGGIDYLIVNAGTAESYAKPTLEMCAAAASHFRVWVGFGVALAWLWRRAGRWSGAGPGPGQG